MILYVPLCASETLDVVYQFFSTFVRCSTMECSVRLGFISLRPDLPNLMKSRAPQVDALRAWASFVDRCLEH